MQKEIQKQNYKSISGWGIVTSLVLISILLTGCPGIVEDLPSDVPTTYTIAYGANGATSGTAPAAQTKTEGVDLTLASNTGSLEKTGYTFAGWNTADDGTGTDYAEGATYTTDADLTLYAKWTVLPTYTVTYDANNSTSGTAPAAQTKTEGVDLTLASNTGSLEKTGYTFAGWNTAADGTGTDYAEGATYTTDEDLTLYAKWNLDAPANLSYPKYVYSLVKGVEVSDITPSVTGTVDTYTIVSDPAGTDLPEGLSFDTSTGSISGTPTAEVDFAKYVITAENTAGNVTTMFYTKVYNTAGATITGTLTLPEGVSLDNKPYAVQVDTDGDGDNGGVVAATMGYMSGNTTTYTIENAPTGDYHIYSVIWTTIDDLSDMRGPIEGDYSSSDATITISGTNPLSMNLSLFAYSQ